MKQTNGKQQTQNNQTNETKMRASVLSKIRTQLGLLLFILSKRWKHNLGLFCSSSVKEQTQLGLGLFILSKRSKHNLALVSSSSVKDQKHNLGFFCSSSVLPLWLPSSTVTTWITISVPTTLKTIYLTTPYPKTSTFFLKTTSDCFSVIKNWMSENKLRLTGGKT